MQPVPPEDIVDARDIPPGDDGFLDYNIACPLSPDGEHNFRIVAIVDDCEIYECDCGLIHW